MTYNSTVLADSPVHYFKLDETTGTNFTNSGSDSYTTGLSKGSGVTLNQTDFISGKAVLLDGSANAYATAFSLYGQYPSSGTSIEVWYKGTDTGTLARWSAGSSSWLVEVAAGGYVHFTWGSTGDWTATSKPVNDGVWHHIVCTVTNSSGTYQIFVDGTKVRDSGPGQSVGNFSSNGDLYLGDNSTAAIAGKVDEFAVYNSVLSPTRISAHYSAAPLPTNITTDVLTATGTALANDVTVAQVLTDVPTATASAVANDVTVPLIAAVDVTTATATASAVDVPLRKTLTPSRDANADEANAPNFSLNPVTLNPGGNGLLVDFDLPSDWTDAGELVSTLTLTFGGSGGSTTLSIRPVTSVWSNSDITHSLGTGISATVPLGGGRQSIDVTSLVRRPFYGFYVTATTGISRTVETMEGSNPPFLALDYYFVPLSVTTDADTAVASAQAVDATVTASLAVSLDTLTAVSSAFEATAEVVVTPDAVITVETLSASSTSVDAQAVLPVTVDVLALTASAQAPDTTQETTQGVVVETDTAHATSTVLGLTDVNGEPIVPTEDEDPYFNSTMFLNPTVWFRMDIASGTTEVARVGSEQFSGQYTNANIGNNGGPNGRKYVHFNGTSMFQQLEAHDETYDYNGTLEFSIRTTKKNQFVMRMDDVRRALVLGAANTDTPSRDLYLNDGKLEYRVWSSGSAVSATMSVGFTGRTDLADGEWHHVILASSMETGSVQFPSTGKVDVYIDGKLELRRTTYGFSFPDYIGGRPGYTWPEYLAIPQSDWFVGDMAEVVFFDRAHFDVDQVLRQNDTIFGFDPVYVETGRATARTYDASARTNAKRVLTIDMAPGTRTLYMTGAPIGFTFAGLAYAGSNNSHAVTVGDYQVFQHSLFRPDSAPGYIDDITDEYRLLDLDTDVDLADFDIINVINFPQSSDDWDYYNQWDRPALFGGLNGRQQVERVLNQIKQFTIDGGGLFLTDPGLAVYLGVIDRVEYVPLLREPQKHNVGESLARTRDLRAAKINPWGSFPNGGLTTIWEARRPAELNPAVDYDALADYYDDEHANNVQRVRKLVTGLTDIPGSILVDSISFFPASNTGEMHAEKWANREDGLQVGDEFRLMGTPHSGRGGSWAGLGYATEPVGPFNRYFGTVAAPIADVKIGTVVTSFGQKIWTEDTYTDNPYKDYAISVVIEPGDLWNGEVVQGRVFMNFTESFADLAPTMMHSFQDIIPLDTPYIETAESREWQWSMWRGSWAGVGGDSTQQTVTVNQDGSLTIKSSSDGVRGITYASRYDRAVFDAPTMHYRGLKWLGEAADASGTATVGLETATATAAVVEANASGQRSADVGVATAVATALASVLADVQETDVEVLVFSAEATAYAGAFREVIDVDTATATAAAHGETDTDAPDMVILRMPVAAAILYMEDK